MNNRRLLRLMKIIAEIKANPRLDPDDMCRKLGISRRQFYKDRDTLSEMGIAFHFSRKSEGFVLDKELTYSSGGVSLAQLMAFLTAVESLSKSGEFATFSLAYQGLGSLAEKLPEPLDKLFHGAMESTVFEDGFGCKPRTLELLNEAIADERQVVLTLHGREEKLKLNPRSLRLADGDLILAADDAGPGGEAMEVKFSDIKKVAVTPFLSPRK